MDATSSNSEDDEKRWTGAELLACAVTQLLLVNVAYRIDRRKQAPLLSTSAWAIFLGLVCGGVLSVMSKTRVHSAGLDPQTLFFGLLPPIILEAGFNTQRKGFFSNFSAILLLAVVGTLIATFATGGILIYLGRVGVITELTSAEAFLYGSLISAIDPVATLLVFKKSEAPSLLFNLVFGESVLNDAAAIVIFTLFKRFVESGNTEVTLETASSMVLEFVSIGVGSVTLAGVICYSSAYLLKHSDPALKEHPTYEISIILLSSYASYVTADLCGWSGLLAVFFSGVFIRHYHMYNISSASSFAFKHLLSTLAFLSENFIYLYLGISVFAFRESLIWDWGFIIANLGACLLARGLNTFPLCALANFGRSTRRKIPFSHMIVIWFSGLRGAIAFALVLNVQTANPEHAAILKSATLFTVLFTTVFLGMGTSPLLSVLGLSGAAEEDEESKRIDSFVPGDLSWMAADSVSGVSKASDEHLYLLGNGHNGVMSSSNSVYLLAPTMGDSPPGSQSVHDAWVEIDEKYLKPLFGGNPRPRSDSTLSTGFQHPPPFE
uniref:Sodium/hydrogen exchanger n=1 Tax=Globisporangium ultimum (strain ATCC 200006 / CBS 805.95 / DAOM BR144) TaxID=431595 RepID=K3WWX7_GLOUD